MFAKLVRACVLLLLLLLSATVPAAAAAVDVYAGPGTSYDAMGTIDTNRIEKAVKIEGDWIEIETSGMRGYIPAAAVPTLCTDQVPRVVQTLSQNVTPYPQTILLNKDLRLFDEAIVCRSPAMPMAVIETLPAGTPVRLLSTEVDDYVTYGQIEVADAHGRWRGYVSLDDLLSHDNPLHDFDGVKQTNAIVHYEGHDYYSTTGMPPKGAVGKQWHIVEEVGLTHRKINVLAGVTAMIAANGLNDDVIQASGGGQSTSLYNAKTRRMENMNLASTKKVNGIAIADAAFSGLSSFAAGADQSTFYKVSLMKCDDERKIVIRTGKPFESNYAGKKLTLYELLTKRNPGSWFSHPDDEYLKRIYPELPKDHRYHMNLTYASDFSENPYGCYIFFDKNFKAYATTIIHSGTEFKIYDQSTFLFDMVPDLARCVIPLGDEDTQTLRTLLEENGFHLTDTETPETERTTPSATQAETPPVLPPRTETPAAQPARPVPQKTRSEREQERQQLSEQKLSELVGTYKGSYVPTQGETGLTLTVYKENGKYWALFDFYNLPGRSNSLTGNYLMKVSYNTYRDTYVLKGWKWLHHPGNYLYANLDGKLENGVLSGTSPWKFRVERIR